MARLIVKDKDGKVVDIYACPYKDCKSTSCESHSCVMYNSLEAFYKRPYYVDWYFDKND